jgi:sugar phosphate isomerase/epimerase
MKQPIAIQSWCLRAFKPLPQFLEQLKSIGVSATELCGIHADFNAPPTFPAIADQFSKAKVQIVAIGVEAMTGEPNHDRSKFEFCKAVGAKNMSFTFSPDVWFDGKIKNVERLADEYDIRCGIHNHGGGDWLGNAAILKHVFSRTTKNIGLHMDTAWALAASQDPLQWTEQFADRLSGIHIKDFTFDRAAHPSDVIIGSGNLDLPKLITLLKKINFSGPLVIEYEGDESNPQPALTQCVAVLKKLI